MSKELKIEQVKELCCNIIGEYRDCDKYELMLAECEMIKLERELWQSLNYAQADIYRKYKSAIKRYFEMVIENIEKQ